nr:Chain A, TWO CHAIN TISSUE PLASMINOGEN ACTIVATOR [Homo sapiens]
SYQSTCGLRQYSQRQRR